MLTKVIYDEDSDTVYVSVTGNTKIVKKYEGKSDKEKSSPFKKEKLSLVDPFDYIDGLEDQLFVWFNPDFSEYHAEDIMKNSINKVNETYFEMIASITKFFNIPLILDNEGFYKREILEEVSDSNFIIGNKKVKFESVKDATDFLKEKYRLISGEIKYLLENRLYTKNSRYNTGKYNIIMKENYCILDPSIILVSRWFLNPDNNFKVTEESEVYFYNKLEDGNHEWITRKGSVVFKAEEMKDDN